MKSNISRRDFLKTSGVIAGSSLISSNLGASSIEDIPFESNKKITVALVGTGSRGIFMWGKDLVDSYSNYIEFVGLCDINEGRVETGKRMIGVSCPTYTDFEKMMKETKPEVLIVTTMDSTHHQFIIRGNGTWCKCHY